MKSFEAMKDALSEKYSIERELGRGGMATVYLALDRKHDRKVAVKVMDHTLTETVGNERFLREIRIVAGLQHPHILSLHDSGEAAGSPYYVMPYVKGGTLAERLSREGPLSQEEATRIARQIGDALAYAHEQGFVHRDVKPANILFNGDHALLADFGVVRPLQSAEMEDLTPAGMLGLTGQGVAIGTPSYMSPEQAGGEDNIGPRSDIYSLGCVLYEMLAGEPPHTGPSPMAILARSLTERPRPLSSVRRVGPVLEAALNRALEPVPADRFATAQDFTGELTKATVEASAGTVIIQRTPARMSTLQRFAAGLVAAVALVATIALVFAVRSGGGGPASVSGAALNRAVILPFSLSGSEDLSHLEQGVANLLSTVIDGVGGLRTVDPAAVMGIVAQEGDDFASPERARSITERLGASRYVSGSIQELGGRITITASLNDLNAVPMEVDRWAVDGDPEADLFQMVNGLSVRLLQGLGVEGTAQELESVTTRSPVALNEFLKAETALGHGDYVGAAESFRSAAQVDSLFALAWFRLSYALSFTEGSSGAVAPAQQAWALSDRLSTRDRRLTEALLASTESEAAEAERLYRAILTDYPNDVEALFGLADLRLHFGPLHGWAMDSLGIDFDRVLYLDDDHSEALLHRPWVAGLDGDVAAIGPAVQNLLELDPEGYYAPVFRTMLAVSESDAAALATANAGLTDDVARLLAVNMSSTLGDLQATGDLATSTFDGPGSVPEARAFGLLVRAHQLAGLGRWREAMEALRAAESLDPAAGLEDRALLMLAPFAPVDREALTTLLGELEEWNAEDVPASLSGNPWIVPHEGFHPSLRLYLLGGVHARLGETSVALSYADQLSVPEGTSADAMVRNTLARNLRAFVAFTEGRHGDGLLELENPGLRGAEARTWERAYSSPFFSESLERFQRGQALAETGGDQAAHSVFAGIWMSNALDVAYMAPAHLARAELYERSGDPGQALPQYERFVDLWQDADAELAERVESARERIRILAGG